MMALGKPLLTWLTLTPRGKGFLMAFPAYEVRNSTPSDLCHSPADLKFLPKSFVLEASSYLHFMNIGRCKGDEWGTYPCLHWLAC